MTDIQTMRKILTDAGLEYVNASGKIQVKDSFGFFTTLIFNPDGSLKEVRAPMNG